MNDRPAVLIVTRRMLIVRILRLILGEQGVDIVQERTLEGGIRALGFRHWNAVVADWGLPGGHAERLCEGAAAGRIPVVALGTCEARSECYRAFEAGATDFRRSPVDAVELAWRLRALMRRAACRAPVPSPGG